MKKRTAAALMITRGDGPDRQVFLAERAPELRFFGGYWALPGGTLNDEDFTTGRADGRHDEATAMQNSAHRELFEELGLLRNQLMPAHRGPEALRQLRRLMLEREGKRGEATGPSPWNEAVGSSMAPLPLRELCRIETPAFAPVRYDTVFYHVPIEDCATGTDELQPDIWPGELVQGRFWAPEQALASWRNGDLRLVPPVVIVLEHLARAADFEHFARDLDATTRGYRNGRLHQVRFSPGIVLAPLKTPTLPPATTTNCYVVGNDELWVVDPGSPHPDEQQRLLDLLDEMTAGGARLAGVLLTHHHRDHIGGAQALCEARQLQVSAHEKTLERLPAGIPRRKAIGDGHRIDLGNSPDGTPGWQLEAMFTPGHDQGHLCFRESRYGAVLVGDMLSTVSTIIIDPPEGHLATYLDSLERLSQLEISTLYPAHGPAARDGQKLVQKYVRHRRQRESKLVEVLAEGPATLEELLPKVYWDADERLFPFAARSLQAGLDKLVEERRAEERDGSWHLRAENP